MKSRSLQAKLDKAYEAEMQYGTTHYQTLRHENGDLFAVFDNDEIYQFPVVPFRPYQQEVVHNLFFNPEKRFYFLVWPRRSGKELSSWSMLLQAAVSDPGLYLMIYPTNVRARMVLWEGAILMPDLSSVRFRDMLPQAFRVKKDTDDDMVIKLVNGSVIWVLGSDIDPDKLRGTNPRGIVMSEYAYSDPRVRLILMPVLRQNGGWMMLQTTYNGMNHAYRLMQEVKENPRWFCRVESIVTLVNEHGQRYITDDMIEEDRQSGMPEYMIQQEYYSVVQLNQETLYFAREMNVLRETKRIISGLSLPNKRVRMHMDLGINDKTACILEQNDHQGDPYLIAYTENNNRSFEYYIRWAESHCAKLGLVLSDIFVPHDGQKRDFNTGKNTVDFGRDLGYTVRVVPKPTSKFNAIQSMRRMLYRSKFNQEETGRLIDCLSNYSKEFDPKRGIYKNNPLHDWSSHGVDSFQTMTLAYEGQMINEVPHDIVYLNI